MAKDALGHGSNSHEVIDTHRGNAVVSQHGSHRKALNATNKLEFTKNEGMPKGGWRYQIRPINTNADAAAQLHSGTQKSAPAPVHDAMTGALPPGGRHGYNPDSVNKAIAASNRGGQRISAGQARAIHALMKGR